ncbi:MAG: AbrB/MazE/SpoVT family DNA-binding domain-containing protein [Trueperaceae bacterium]|nr:MAG: AbrB/MazE/SpoVT family DNA-binding domain-containing protein [Trueperaceae bacterium]
MAELIRIGNSRGVRIPKALIDQAGLEGGELELKVVRGGLLIRPLKRPRQGWREAVDAALEHCQVEDEQAWLEADLDSELDKFPSP